MRGTTLRSLIKTNLTEEDRVKKRKCHKGAFWSNCSFLFSLIQIFKVCYICYLRLLAPDNSLISQLICVIILSYEQYQHILVEFSFRSDLEFTSLTPTRLCCSELTVQTTRCTANQANELAAVSCYSCDLLCV